MAMSHGMRTFATYDILAVTTRSPATLVLGDLHKALLARSADSVRVAGALLHGDRRNEDGRD